MVKFSPEIQKVLDEFLSGLKVILKDNLHAVYIYGAVVFPEDIPVRDIDFHVVVKKPVDEKTIKELEKFHLELARKYPQWGEELDGYYISLNQAIDRKPPRSFMWDQAVDHSWALHRQHLLAGRCKVLWGGDPATMLLPPEWPEIEKALKHEFDYLKDILVKYPDYCILNLSRILYSFSTRDVVISKFSAGNWLADNYPPWANLINAAKNSYRNTETSDDKELMDKQILIFNKFIIGKIEDLGIDIA